MATKLAAQFEYSDAELLALYREALAHLAVNKSYSIRGKTYTRADEAFIRSQVEWLEKRIDAAVGKSRVAFSQHARRV